MKQRSRCPIKIYALRNGGNGRFGHSFIIEITSRKLSSSISYLEYLSPITRQLLRSANTNVIRRHQLLTSTSSGQSPTLDNHQLDFNNPHIKSKMYRTSTSTSIMSAGVHKHKDTSTKPRPRPSPPTGQRKSFRQRARECMPANSNTSMGKEEVDHNSIVEKASKEVRGS